MDDVCPATGSMGMAEITATGREEKRMATTAGTMPGARSVRVTLWILLIVYIFNFIDRQIVNILAEPIAKDLDLSDTQIGFLMTGLAFGAVLHHSRHSHCAARRPFIDQPAQGDRNRARGVVGDDRSVRAGPRISRSFCSPASGVGVGEAGLHPACAFADQRHRAA